MKINLKSLLFHTLVPIMLSFTIMMLIPDYSDFYESLNVPIRIPPIVFGIVWPILYLLMGISAYFIDNYEANSTNALERSRAMKYYYLQLLINLAYPVVFFYLNNIPASTVITIVLLVMVIITTIKFYSIRKISGYLLIPYILWLIIANYLQIGIYFLNLPK